jgi:hypothetical protein
MGMTFELVCPVMDGICEERKRRRKSMGGRRRIKSCKRMRGEDC